VKFLWAGRIRRASVFESESESVFVFEFEGGQRGKGVGVDRAIR
jgi:hypothetical protein